VLSIVLSYEYLVSILWLMHDVGRSTLGTLWVNSVKLKGWRRPVLVTFVVSRGSAWSVMLPML
jgi:hypothetical protein